MTKTVQWIVGGAAAVALAVAVYAVPAMAAGTTGGWAQGMSNTISRGGYGMMGGGDMGIMHNLMGQMPYMHDQVMGDMAEMLGLSEQELYSALNKGQSLSDLAEANGVALGEIRGLMTSSMATFFDEMVAQGQITGEEAGRMLAYMAQNLEYCLTGQMGGMMMGGGMMGGGSNGGSWGGGMMGGGSGRGI